ncbi:hypothetical protein ACQPUZ_19220, partial [Clostridium tertium]
IEKHLENLENNLNKKLGCHENPLLLSVRSGAVFSMPGMMDTILNLGLNDISVQALSKATQNERFAYDSYRRFIQMFSDVAMGIPKYKFENVLDDAKESKGYKFDTELTVEDLITWTLKTGDMSVAIMQKLDEANTTIYKNPAPHKVNVHVKKGPFIVVSGHDLKDLEMLLKQTEGKGINIYTHGEMIPCH